MTTAQHIAICDHEARLHAAHQLIAELNAMTAILFVALDEMIAMHGATPRAADAMTRVTGANNG